MNALAFCGDVKPLHPSQARVAIGSYWENHPLISPAMCDRGSRLQLPARYPRCRVGRGRAA